MRLTRDQAHALLRQDAGVEDTHAPLSADEIESVLDQSRIADAEGRFLADPLYVETIWGEHAVVRALDMRVRKLSEKADVLLSGTSVLASQRVAQLRAHRGTWRSRMLSGSA